MITAAALARRRRRLARHMGDGVAVVAGGSRVPWSRDEEHPFRQRSHFRYLAGCAEPDCAIVLAARGGRLVHDEILCRPRDPAAERWSGRRLGPAGAAKAFGFSRSRPIGELERAVAEAAEGHTVIHHGLGEDARLDRIVCGLAARRRLGARARLEPIDRVVDWQPAVDRMRLVKEPAELALMRRAAAIAAEAHRLAMRSARTARREHEVEAALIGHYRSEGAVHAFEPIVASGANACVLHYSSNDQEIARDGLLLVDSGCELAGYCSDITRTYPVSGRFTPAQRELYSVVLAAQKDAIAAVRPGVPCDLPERVATESLTRGLVRLGLVKGPPRAAIRRGAHREFYPHRVGHWLGMDVHDVGPYVGPDRRPLRLEPGMVLTIEPGLYVGQGRRFPARYRGIGIRIEDDIVVTRDGAANITEGVPKEIDDIETFLA